MMLFHPVQMSYTLKKESYLKGKEIKKKKKKGQAGWNRAFKSPERFATQILRSKQLPLWMKQGSDPFLCHNSPHLLNMFSLVVKQTSILSALHTHMYQKRHHIVLHPVLEEIEDVFEWAFSDVCCLNCSVTLLVMK